MEKLSPLYTSAHWAESSPYLSMATYEVKSEIAHEYKQAAITHKNISIVGLPGQEITLKEVKHRQFWQNDPHPNLETEILTKDISVIGGKATLFGGEAKLWQHLQETVEELTKENQIFLDIHNLTPPEAVLLIKELIRRKLNYDDLIADSVTAEKINSNEVKTARPELLDHFTNNPKKYRSLTRSYTTKVDFMTTDQIIKHGFAVCRHVAAVSSILYQVLRNNQHSLLLNGSHLLYHNENLGDQWPKACVDNHSYNILYVTHPGKSEIKINLSVIDSTFTMSSDDFNSDPDYTSTRLSQACSSLFEYANLFGIDQNAVTNLADLALKRTKDKLDQSKAIFHFLEKSATVDKYLSDYTSLALQGTPGKHREALEVVYQAYLNNGLQRENMIENILKIPPVTYKNKDNQVVIKFDWIPEVIKQLNKIDFSKKSDIKAEIYNCLTTTATQITTDMLIKDKSSVLMSFLDMYQQISQYY